MKDKKIAVVVGGPSTEAEVSRRTGAAIADALTKKGYHIETIELVPKEFAKTLTEKGIDIVFNALHGRYGEDGVIQGLCEMMGIPYTGPGVMASAVGMNKVMSKAAFRGPALLQRPLPTISPLRTGKPSLPTLNSASTCLSSSSRPVRARVSARSLSRPRRNSVRPWKKPSSTALRW